MFHKASLQFQTMLFPSTYYMLLSNLESHHYFLQILEYLSTYNVNNVPLFYPDVDNGVSRFKTSFIKRSTPESNLT